jgi:hypothetical protein
LASAFIEKRSPDAARTHDRDVADPMARFRPVAERKRWPAPTGPHERLVAIALAGQERPERVKGLVEASVESGAGLGTGDRGRHRRDQSRTAWPSVGAG